MLESTLNVPGSIPGLTDFGSLRVYSPEFRPSAR